MVISFYPAGDCWSGFFKKGIMDQRIRDFVESYKLKPMPAMTIREFVRSHNKPLKKICPKCKSYNDLRVTFYCSDCGKELDPTIIKSN